MNDSAFRFSRDPDGLGGWMMSRRHTLLRFVFGISIALIGILILFFLRLSTSQAQSQPLLPAPQNFDAGWEYADTSSGYIVVLKWGAPECEYEAPGTSLCGSTADYVIERDPPFPADSQERTKRLIQNGTGFWGELAPHGVPVNDGAILFDKDVEAKDEQAGKTGQYTYSVWAKKIGIDDHVYESEEPATITVTIDPEKPEECPDFKLYGAQDGDQLHFWWPAVCDATQYTVETVTDVYEYLQSENGYESRPIKTRDERQSWIQAVSRKEDRSEAQYETLTLTVVPGRPISKVTVTAQLNAEDEEVVDLGSDQLQFTLTKFVPPTKVSTYSYEVVSNAGRGSGWGYYRGSTQVDTYRTIHTGFTLPSCKLPRVERFEGTSAPEEVLYTQAGYYIDSTWRRKGVNFLASSDFRLKFKYPPEPVFEFGEANPEHPGYPPKPEYVAWDGRHVTYVSTYRENRRRWSEWLKLAKGVDKQFAEDSAARRNRQTAAYVAWLNERYGNGHTTQGLRTRDVIPLLGPFSLIDACNLVPLGAPTLEVKELEYVASEPTHVETVGAWQIQRIDLAVRKMRYTMEVEPVSDLPVTVRIDQGILRHASDLEVLRAAAQGDGTVSEQSSYQTNADGRVTIYTMTPISEAVSLEVTSRLQGTNMDLPGEPVGDGTVFRLGRYIKIPARPPAISISKVTGQTTASNAGQVQTAYDFLSPATKTVSLTVKSTDLSGRPDLRGGDATIEVRNNFGGPMPTLTTGAVTISLNEGRGEFALSPLSFTSLNLTVPDDAFNRTGVEKSAYTVAVSRTMKNGQTFTSEAVIPVATKDLPAPELALSLPDAATIANPPILGAGTTVPVTLRAFRPLGKADGSTVEEPVANLPVAIAVSGYKLRTTDPTDDTSAETTAWHSQTVDDKDSVSIEGPDGAVWEIGDVTATLLPSLPEPLVTDAKGELTLSLTLPTDLPPTVGPPVYTLTATVTDNSTGTEKETTAELPVAVALRTMAVTTETDQTIPGQSGDVTVTVSELGADGTTVGPVADATVAVSTSIPKARQILLGQTTPTTNGATILGISEADSKEGVSTEISSARQLTLTTDGAGELRIPVSQLQTQRFPDLPLEFSIAVSKPGFASLTLSGEKVATAQLQTRTQPVYHARTDGDLTSEFDVHFTLTTAYGDPIDWYFDQVMETRKTGEDRIDEELYKTFAWLTPGATYDPIAAFDETILMAQNPIVTDAGLGKVSFQRIESVAQSVDLVAVLRLPFLLGYGEFLTSRLGLTLPGSETPAANPPSEDTGGSSDSPSPEVTSVESSEPPTAEPSAEGAPEP